MGNTCSHDNTECIIENDNTFDTSSRNLSRNVKAPHNRSNKILKSTFSKIEEEDYIDSIYESTIIQNMTSAVYDGLDDFCASSNAKIAYKQISNEEFNEKLKETNIKIDEIIKANKPQLNSIKKSYSASNQSDSIKEYRVGPICFYDPTSNAAISYYRGDFTAEGIKQGYGEEIMANKTIYMGVYQNGKFSCEGMLVYENGDYYIGNFYNGNVCNKGTLVLTDYITYTGEWKDNKKNGYGIETCHEDESVYEGEFVNGEKEGKGVLKFKDGSYYSGNFKNSKFDGEGQFNWPDGKKYVGEFREGKIHGKGEYTWPDGNRYVGCYENGVKKGEGVYYWKSGNYFKGNFLNNNMHGEGVVNFNGGEYKVVLRFGKIIHIDVVNSKDSSQVELKEKIEQQINSIEQ